MLDPGRFDGRLRLVDSWFDLWLWREWLAGARRVERKREVGKSNWEGIGWKTYCIVNYSLDGHEDAEFRRHDVLCALNVYTF